MALSVTESVMSPRVSSGSAQGYQTEDGGCSAVQGAREPKCSLRTQACLTAFPLQAKSTVRADTPQPCLPVRAPLSLRGEVCLLLFLNAGSAPERVTQITSPSPSCQPFPRLELRACERLARSPSAITVFTGPASCPSQDACSQLQGDSDLWLFCYFLTALFASMG